MSSGHYCDGCAQAYYKCTCNKPNPTIKDDDAEQFKNTGKQVVIWPAADKQGDPITPFAQARKAG